MYEALQTSTYVGSSPAFLVPELSFDITGAANFKEQLLALISINLVQRATEKVLNWQV